MSYHNPEYLITRHKKWIYNQAKFLNDTLSGNNQIGLCKKKTNEEFVKLINTYVSAYAQKINVHPKRINIKKMKTRWGSCSILTGNITLNSHLRYLPEKSIKYVIFHELTHLIRRNHDKDFWERIAQEFPDYKKMGKDLLGYRYLLEKKQIM
jgi:predicted metal-dependent hydrolase